MPSNLSYILIHMYICMLNIGMYLIVSTLYQLLLLDTCFVIPYTKRIVAGTSTFTEIYFYIKKIDSSMNSSNLLNRIYAYWTSNLFNFINLNWYFQNFLFIYEHTAHMLRGHFQISENLPAACGLLMMVVVWQCVVVCGGKQISMFTLSVHKTLNNRRLFKLIDFQAYVYIRSSHMY